MPLSAHARRVMRSGLGNAEAADDIADVIDADGGTISAHSLHHLVHGMGNRQAATLFETAVNADSAIDGYTQRHLSNMLGDAGVAVEIAAELGA